MSRPLRIATFLAPSVIPVYEAVAARVRRQIERPVELVVGESFAQFAAGDLDAGFICGLPYVVLARQHPPAVKPLAAPVLVGERYGGRQIYFSDVIVRSTSGARNFADLRGVSWAYNDVDSHSGYNLTQYRLVEMGETSGFFGQVVAAGFHQRAIAMVAAGEVDAAAIDSQVLAIALRDDPELAESIRIIDTFGPSTIQPFVVASHLPDTLTAAIRSAVLTLGERASEREALRRGFVARFAPISDADYDDIRAMLATVEGAGFQHLR
jgi:phosphonate transport system substrate-binding protein